MTRGEHGRHSRPSGSPRAPRAESAAKDDTPTVRLSTTNVGRTSAPRWPALILIPALLLGMALLDDDEAEPAASEPEAQALGAAIASDDSLGAFWFCAGGTGESGGLADHFVVVLNTTDQERKITYTIYGSRPENGDRPEPAVIQTTLPPYGREHRRLGDSLGTPYVSATVEVDGGGVLVEHTVNGAQGFDRAPCATTASPTWTVPMGAADISGPDAKARELLVFFNPYPADAVLDVTFSTEDGVRDPEVFNGFVVSGRSVTGVDVTAPLGQPGVTVSTEVAAEVVARTGRVVVDRVQIYNDPGSADPDSPQPARTGIALSSGHAEAAESWTFAVGGQDATSSEKLFVYNPSDVPADIDVEIRPDTSTVTAASEPFELTIQPHRHVSLDLATEERMTELRSATPPTPYSLVVRSADGSRVSAERLRWGTPGLAGSGVATSTGTAVASRRLVADMTGAETGSTLVLVNPSTETVARVRLSVIVSPGTTAESGPGRLTDPVGDATIDLPPGGRRAIPVAQLGSGVYAVVAESDAPILGERDVIIGTERFIAAAVPDAATTVIAQPSLFADEFAN